MNRMRKALRLLLTIVILNLPSLLKAQAFDDDVLDNPVPLDGGAVVLIALAIGYGLKKIYDGKKAEKI